MQNRVIVAAWIPYLFRDIEQKVFIAFGLIPYTGNISRKVASFTPFPPTYTQCASIGGFAHISVQYATFAPIAPLWELGGRSASGKEYTGLRILFRCQLLSHVSMLDAMSTPEERIKKMQLMYNIRSTVNPLTGEQYGPNTVGLLNEVVRITSEDGTTKLWREWPSVFRSFSHNDFLQLSPFWG